MLFSSCFATLFCALATAEATSLPTPRGRYNTSIEHVQLIDQSRKDPFSSSSQPRKLMATIFTPVEQDQCIPTQVSFLDSTTATFQDQKFGAYGLPAGLFGTLELTACTTTATQSKQPKVNQKALPLVILSPALATTRLFYSVMAQNLASSGYVVISVDHPYDVDIVTFPDNSTILGVDISDAQLPLALDTRVKDISFVINQALKPAFAKQYLQPLGSSPCHSVIDTTHIGVLGHSFGGAAAAESLLHEKKVVAGINLDGSFFGQVVEKGTRKPILILAHDGKNQTTDPSWAAIWPQLKGWKKEVMMKAFAHYTFSDLPIIVDTLGIRDGLPNQVVGELLGSVAGSEADRDVHKYVLAFFDISLKNKRSTVL